MEAANYEFDLIVKYRSDNDAKLPSASSKPSNTSKCLFVYISIFTSRFPCTVTKFNEATNAIDRNGKRSGG